MKTDRWFLSRFKCRGSNHVDQTLFKTTCFANKRHLIATIFCVLLTVGSTRIYHQVYHIQSALPSSNMDTGQRSSTPTTTVNPFSSSRLPPISSLSKSSLPAINGKSISLNGNFTKGGAAKRVFKPTIPTSRKIKEEVKPCDDNQHEVNGKGKRGGKQRSTDEPGKSNKFKGKKKLIQMESTFNGINAAPNVKAEKVCYDKCIGSYPSFKSGSNSQHNLRNGENGLANGGDGSSSIFIKQEKREDEDIEMNSEQIERILYRDDFVSDSNPNDDDKAPIGWSNVTQQQNVKSEENDDDDCKKDVKPMMIPFDEWSQTTGDNDKLVCFQLPQMILNRDEGKIGKLRIYKSGRMELYDNKTGLVYELHHTRIPEPTDRWIKSEHGSDIGGVNHSQTSVYCDESSPIHREAVAFDGEEIVCLGPVDGNDILIARPRIEKFFPANS